MKNENEPSYFAFDGADFERNERTKKSTNLALVSEL